MDISSLILTDAGLDAIDNGIWVGDLPGLEGVKLRVTGIGGEAAQKSLQAKKAALRLSNGGKPLTDEQSAKAMCETLAEVVLKDWDGLTDGGNPVKYNKELATKWLTSRNGAAFAGVVLAAAQKVDNNANELTKELSKN